MRESSQARRAYSDYLAQTPPRSLQRLADEYRSRSQGVAGDVPTRQVSRLMLWSQRHNWQERIAAHEQRLAAEREAEDAGKRSKMAEARIAIAIAEMDLGSRGLRAKRPEDLSARDIVALLQHSFDAQRKDLGEPDQRVSMEVAGPDGRDITVRVIYDDGGAAGADAAHDGNS